ncbi:MAG: TSUP family transporter [Ilumatobacter sp.]|uniref:TSUP family transporter n=1 Tax=Ilumatobacter sp. TaxID=1967498 RepID=UPI003C7148D9
MVELIVIGVAAFSTAVLSAVAGLGGGVILLLVIAQFVAPTTAIPIQGAIQLVANGSRAALLRRTIAWPVVGWSSLLLLPGSLLGVAIATSVPENAVRLALAAFVLVLAWRPHWLKLTPSPGSAADRSEDDDRSRARERRPMLIGLGAATGLLNSTVGASGPVTSPFLKAVTATHVAFVATAAATQVAAHAAKLFAFTTDGWDIVDHVDVIATGVVGVVAGSWIGTRLLGRISTTDLDVVFKVVLTALAVRLVVTAVA